MILGELWWTRLVNSVRFLDDIKDELMDKKSVMLCFDDDIPWCDIMIDTLEQQIPFLTETHAFEIHNAAKIKEKPGEYLFNKYISEHERIHDYWITQTHEEFIGKNENTPLHHRALCITGISTENAADWVKTVNDYLENCNTDEHGVFILIVQGASPISSKHIETIKYSDYVTDYDCLMLCMTVLSSEKCNSIQKQYVSEIASNIAKNNIEIAGVLASEGYKLAISPFKTTSAALHCYDIRIANLSERVKSGVWEAQIKLVFPRLEEFRCKLAQKYDAKLKSHLPITSSSGERVDKVSDLELGQLYFICSSNRNILQKYEFEMLKKMRETRNLLAHQNTLTIDQLTALNFFNEKFS